MVRRECQFRQCELGSSGEQRTISGLQVVRDLYHHWNVSGANVGLIVGTGLSLEIRSRASYGKSTLNRVGVMHEYPADPNTRDTHELRQESPPSGIPTRRNGNLTFSICHVYRNVQNSYDTC
uniref:uncharacterized protein LOC117605292 n=1 Tax=Osmia lignaria TaxID=473952 RepID=UPI0014784210|nr:uncharacterized protein LOC117605292 [Osmia lignaria]